MSILSALAFLASGIAAKIRPEPQIKSDNAILAELQAKVDDLNRQFDETLASVTRQCDDWQSLAMSYRREVMEQRSPTEMLQARAAMQAAQAQQAQYSMQQNGPMFGMQFGMQNFGQHLDEYVRNCTPGRHDLFLRG